MRKTTTITVYPKVEPLVTKISILYPRKVSILFNYALYRLFQENSDVLRLVEEAEEVLSEK